MIPPSWTASVLLLPRNQLRSSPVCSLSTGVRPLITNQQEFEGHGPLGSCGTDLGTRNIEPLVGPSILVTTATVCRALEAWTSYAGVHVLVSLQYSSR